MTIAQVRAARVKIKNDPRWKNKTKTDRVVKIGKGSGGKK